MVCDLCQLTQEGAYPKELREKLVKKNYAHEFPLHLQTKTKKKKKKTSIDKKI